MSVITIIGSGNMAQTIGTRAAEHGHHVEIMSRDASKAQALASRIGHGATTAPYGSAPSGDIVVVAVLFAGAVEAVSQFGDRLAGKILVDITNPFNSHGTGVETSVGHSISQQIADAAPGTRVLKAFNINFRAVLAQAGPLDIFFAGGDSSARAEFGAFLTSVGWRPIDVGGPDMTHVLEWMGVLILGVANNGAGFDVALSVEAR